jgi:hypothetical protein
VRLPGRPVRGTAFLLDITSAGRRRTPAPDHGAPMGARHEARLLPEQGHGVTGAPPALFALHSPFTASVPVRLTRRPTAMISW